MTELPEPQHSVASLIYAAYEARDDPPRYHLGASLLGHHCSRWIWLSFRWAVVEKFDGRMLRLFERGAREEEVVIANLRAAGMKVEGQQKGMNLGHHVGGSIDGIVTGIPAAPNKRHILEIKTHNAKSFAALTKEGVEKSKPQHFCQMQIYMHGTGIDRALYVAVNKDTDQIHTERVRYSKEDATALLARAKEIATANRPPFPISENASWWECKMCAAHDFCHVSKATKEVNCRTCAHSTATAESTWTCERWGREVIPDDAQRAGCPSHILHPDLVPWPMSPGENDYEVSYEIDGKPVRNGEPDAFTFASAEILANPSACARQDKLVMACRNGFEPGQFGQIVK